MKHIFSKSNRALLAELVRTDFKLRYQGSALGYAWSLLRPLFMFGILFVVFNFIFKVGKGIPNYPIYLFVGIVLWNFFNEMTSQSLGSIVARGSLIRKVRIPRWMIIVSTSIAALINVSLNLIIVLVLSVTAGLDFMPTSIYLPLFVLEVYIFALGVSLILAPLFVKYRDITYIWDVITQAGFYATPILYPLTLVKHELVQKIIFINPMAQAIQGARQAYVTKTTITIGEVYGTPWAVLIPLTVIMIVLVIGVMYFKKQAPKFAEEL